MKSEYFLDKNDTKSQLDFICDIYSTLKIIIPEDELLKYVERFSPLDIVFSENHYPEFLKRFSNDAVKKGLKEDSYKVFMIMNYGIAMRSRLIDSFTIDSKDYDIRDYDLHILL